MEQEFHTKLHNLLKTDHRFVDRDGQLLTSSVIDKAWKQDNQLVKLLLSDMDIKSKFFDPICAALVFKAPLFIDYVSDKDFLSNSYTRFKNKIGLSQKGQLFRDQRDLSLVWPYKDCVLEGGQTKEDKKSQKEIFFNEILAEDEINRFFDPKVLTHWKRHTASGVTDVKEIKRDEDGLICENLVIKGNNLSALHTLKAQFQGKVKLIYIDPPYNTKGDANTFLYNNGFNHSAWLTFMKNRLEVAKDLLKKDGVVAIAIDDEEQAYLKVMCDEIFNKDNHIGTLIIQTKPSGRTTDTYFATSHEYVHFYSKNKGLPKINFFELTDKQKKQYSQGDKWRDFLRTGGYSTPKERPNSYYPIYFNPKTKDIRLKKTDENDIEILPLDSQGNQRVWRKTPDSFLEHLANKEIKIESHQRGFKVKLIDKMKEGTRPKSVWIDSKYDASSHGTKLLKKIFNNKTMFSFPKSIHAVKDILDLFTERGGNDLVLDFFAGSGTTAEAVLDLNQADQGHRKFILCEQMDYIQTVTVSRIMHSIKKYKKSDFIYCELMKYNEAYMDKIQEATSSQELLALWKDISKNSFLNWYVNEKMPDQAIEDFMNIGKSDGIEAQKKLLAQLLNKNQLYVHLSEIEDKNFKVSQQDKDLNQAFFKINQKKDELEDEDE